MQPMFTVLKFLFQVIFSIFPWFEVERKSGRWYHVDRGDFWLGPHPVDLDTFPFASQTTTVEFPGMIGASLSEPWFWQEKIRS